MKTMHRTVGRIGIAAGAVLALSQGVAIAAEWASYTNSIGMKMVLIDAGRFRMGSAEGGDFDERPAHTVTISRSFAMAATEVTNAQYERFDSSHRALRGIHGISQDDDEAVVFVSHGDAERFCRWLSEREGKPYRLPTEAEWEYACRAGTTTAYHTGNALPEAYHKHQKEEWYPVNVPLHVGGTPANPWGLHDMHGNVEEWCLDWYGPYGSAAGADPVGPAGGDFRVTRGGSHTTPVAHLRSANRAGTIPADKHWMIGFRVVEGERPGTLPASAPPPPRWAQGVRQDRHAWPGPPGYDPATPYFRGPTPYVKIPPDSNGPMFSHHNHQPAITACPNGDLLAIWYSCNRERGRELTVVASRLRRESEVWEPAAPFWDAPDRNDHGSDIWWDGDKTLYHFNGLSTDMGWAKLALIIRTSTNNGATWSPARLIGPEHKLHHQVIAGAFKTQEGHYVVKCDAVRGGNGGTAIHVSRDRGKTWVDPGAGKPNPTFAKGGTGAWIAGIHAGVAQRSDGALIALGRGDSIDAKMPRSISRDMGGTWTYAPSGFAPIGGGQRPVLLRLREGPLFFASFAKGQLIPDSTGTAREVSGLFGALSYDDGETWPVRRLVTDGKPARRVEGGGNTGAFTMGPTLAEPRGYMAGRQTPDGIIHLISSKQHYAFNVAWLKAHAPR